ncbi:MAG: preprotein translocase subunit SecY [Bacilli bacterium]|jgi:preprotein translocase, secY subunit|nr:protein translocase subunit SecY [Firmicutes bacterium CAG:345]
MKKVSAILHNKEIMNRILFTLAIFLIFRIGSALTVPGVEISKDAFDTNNVFGMLNLMGGGALQSFSLFALGVSPYITAQIIVQLLQMDVLPVLTELGKEGESGRKKIDMATRYLTLLLGAVQAYGVTVTMMNSDYITLTDTTILGYLKIIVYLVAGSMLLMWLGDQITTKGIGNGISMIIFAGIVSALPNQIYGAFANYLSQNLLTGNPSLILEGVIKLLLYLLSFFLIVVFVTYTEKSVRKLPVSHSATGQSGNENAQSSFLPIKINSSGVIPVIFASSIMMAPSIIVSFVSGGNTVPNWAQTMINVFNYQSMVDMGTWSFPWGLIIYLFLIIVFTFFYSNLQINPERLAKDFHDNGTYITGLRPGNETEKYIRKVLNRVTLLGALALMLIAALPIVLSLTGLVPQSLALGGTGLIIVVGVAIEVFNQINGLLAAQDY